MLKKIKENKPTLIVMTVCILLFLLCAFFANRDAESPAEDYQNMAEYENGKVLEVISDNTIQDPASDYAYRGEQMLTVLVETGRYKGETLLAYNYVGPVYSVPAKPGDKVTLIISTYANGDHSATVFELNHLPGILLLLLLFVLAAVIIGKGNGARSLLGLAFIVLCLFYILFPALMKGADTVAATFTVCVLISMFSFTVMSGVNKKSICAFLGTVSGISCAFLFALFAQRLLRVDGLRMEDAEALLQLRQTGTLIGLKGLLSASIIISSLGAVMDVAMGLASASQEISEADPQISMKDLFLSCMNIGKDMVGTMTSTLILAFLGSGFVLILYLYSLNLQKYQLFSSAYVSIEIISGLSSSIGAILSVPITAFISAKAFSKNKTS
jgi:uncharacterized membrane protein